MSYEATGDPTTLALANGHYYCSSRRQYRRFEIDLYRIPCAFIMRYIQHPVPGTETQHLKVLVRPTQKVNPDLILEPQYLVSTTY